MNCQLSNRLLAAKERETQELVGKVDSYEKNRISLLSQSELPNCLTFIR